ncbi:MAG: phosphonoacetaldehyde hydrolase [Bacteroidetes bacterium]|jgi:phosphonoacetaldehyde hydrolase|nr:phosphonoacetaldehyde hydrolase [Bacteroidota bacterium]
MQLKGSLKAVIFDWAGTTVDYGCIAPTRVFVEVLAKKGIEITMQDAREPMGLAKKDHLVALLKMDKVQQQWKQKYQVEMDEDIPNKLYNDLEPSLAAIVADYSTPINGAVDLLEQLRRNHVKVGSTTGYVSTMMDRVIPVAGNHGFTPDAIITSSDVTDGRPKPWMCYLNAIRLNVFPMHHTVKIGDTIADIEEGLNAGMWTIGITKSGNEVGLSEHDVQNADPTWLRERLQQSEVKMKKAGAHYVVQGIWECAEVLQEIDSQIKHGETPLSNKQFIG